jgi:outer membrane protein assembly factor BamB
LETGAEIWRCGGINLHDNYHPTLRLVSSAAAIPGLIIVPTAKNGPVFALQPPLAGDVTSQANSHRWKLERGTPDVATPVIHNDLVYLATEKGTLTCLDAKTGETVYSERTHADKHRSTPVIAGDKLYIAGRDGQIHVIQTGRELKILASNDLGEETTASPAIANGRLYIRTFSALYCFEN